MNIGLYCDHWIRHFDYEKQKWICDECGKELDSWQIE